MLAGSANLMLTAHILHENHNYQYVSQRTYIILSPQQKIDSDTPAASQQDHANIGFQHVKYAEKRKEKKVSSISQKLLLCAVQVFSEQQQARPGYFARVPEDESCRWSPLQQRTTTTVPLRIQIPPCPSGKR